MSSRLARIAPVHRAKSEELLAIGGAVCAVCPPEIVEQLDGEMQRLRDWRARIAIIGQVKAGKSTFLSALVGKPGFLPTEVNPWTSVVTNIHIGHPDDPREGGEFHFFNEDAWGRIVHGDEQTRELAEELLPGFRSDVLAEQVAKMQEQARTRLGRYYNLLLGESHKYETITAETLERYVCAGPTDPETSPSETLGRYSDITERADIYLPDGIFDVPVVISDTPGVNDPFLVRDEYTCQSLNEAEVFVILLSAHQAMTEVDLALVRMLGVNKANHVIIFINRIDELENFDLQTPQIVADVEARVRKAIPDGSFSVIAGSARWAELALSPETDKTAIEALTNRPDSVAYLSQQNAKPPKDPHERIFRLSGLKDVSDALSSAIDDGVGLSLRQSVTRNMLATLGACRNVLATKGSGAFGGGKPADNRARQAKQSEAARALKVEMDAMIQAGGREIDAEIAACTSEIRTGLEDKLQAFIAARHKDLSAAIKKALLDEVFDFNLLDLRNILEDHTVRSYGQSRSALDTKLGQLAAISEETLKPLLGEFAHSDALTDLPHDQMTPVFLTSSRVLSMELTSPTGWKFWRDTRIKPKEGAEKLQQLVEAETRPSLEHLVALCEGALRERAATATTRISSLVNAMLNAISNRQESADNVEMHLQEIAKAEDVLKRLREGIPSEIIETPARGVAS